MKVLIVAAGYPTIKYPGVGIFEYDQALALAKEGISVDYLSIDFRSLRKIRPFGFEIKKENKIKFFTFSYPISPMPFSIKKFFGNKVTEYFFKTQDQSYDIIHVHFSAIYAFTSKSLLKTSIPIILTEHSSINFTNIKKSYFHKFNPKLISSVISVSEGLKKVLLHNFGILSVVIPNIYDDDIFKYNKEIGLKSKDEFFSFVSVGNLVSIKRMDLLIRSFHKLSTIYPNINLTIIGDGPKKRHLMNLVKKLELSKSVFLLGNKKREEIANYFEMSHSFVLASDFETFGLVFIEAMASGLPVIATSSVGPLDFVTPQNGIIIEKDNEQKLIEAMEYMIHNKNIIFNSHFIHDYAKKNYSRKAVANKLIILYRSLSS